MLLVETKKDKKIRLLLIVFFVSLTALGFFLKYNEKEADPQAVAIVIEKSQGDHNPEVVMYEFKHERHFLAKYEIERNNKFRFRTLTAIELPQHVEELHYDQAGDGFWVKMENDWRYYNQGLIEEQHSSQSKIPPARVQFSEKRTDTENWLLIEGKHKIKIPKDESVVGIHPLSIDGSLWMVITNNSVKIVTG